MDEEAKTPPNTPPGAILSDRQIATLKRTVAIMTAILMIGVITLIGRIIYLASNRGDVSQVGAQGAQAFKSEAAANLPAGHEVKAISMSGNRLLIHHVGPTGDGVIILDLATGEIVSRVTIRRGP